MKMIANSLRKSIPAMMGLSLFIASSCAENEIEPVIAVFEGDTSLVFDARFGEAEFELNKTFEATSGAQTFNYEFARLRYWVSNVVFINTEGEEFKVPNSYYLLEETTEIPVQDGTFGKTYPANKREAIHISNVPAGDYSAVKFHIGVEPKYNDNLTLQVGELNPLNGMATDSWMWFTSYIFTSTSGKIIDQNDATQTKNFFWETGSNEMYSEKLVEFAQPITINSNTNSSVNLKLNVIEVIKIELPWENTVIGATRPEMMEALQSNYINAISLVSANGTAKN